jgi:hypothetical protein
MPAATPTASGLKIPTLATAPTPVAAPANVNPTQKLSELSRAAIARYQSIDSYIARFRRREVVGNKAKPEELMLIKFRKEPWSVYFKWLGKEGNGREVVFVAGRYDDKLHTLLAAGDVPLLPAGKRFSISPDSSLVKNASRHSVREAGIGTLIGQFANLVAANSKVDSHPALLRYLGQERRPEFDVACDAVEQQIQPGAEPGFPRGGKRLWVFDPATNLPNLIIAWDEHQNEVEYYCYDRLEYPANLTDADFNPDIIWKPK